MTLPDFNWDAVRTQMGATADPAANNNPANITVPSGKRWLLLSIFYPVVMDANAANRRINVQIKRDGTNISHALMNSTNLTASATWNVCFMAGISEEVGSGSGGVNYYQSPLGGGRGGLELAAGAVITTSTINMQVGDDYGAVRYAYKEAPL